MTESDKETLTIQTPLGDLEGIYDEDVLHFLGIPYAKPPVGQLRFLPPERADSWSDKLDATNYPNRCMQAAQGIFDGPELGALSEDCLYLNIATPGVNSGNHPVLFWIHGGGFTAGSANGYNGSQLVKRGNVVVVTINYRLGLFGFLDLSEFGSEFHGSSSNGLRDQIAALAWVRDNIAAFGGDPDNVTIFGESAGGASVLALLASPSADGLYHKAIAHSPGTASQSPPDVATPLAAHFGVDKSDLVEKLRSMSAAELFATQAVVPGISVGVDDAVVTRRPFEAVLDRGQNGVPLIAGTNRDEGKFFSALLGTFGAPLEPLMLGLAQAVMLGNDPSDYMAALKEAFPDAEQMLIYEYVWDALFRNAAISTAAAATTTGVGGWLYQFDLPTTKPFFGHSIGAGHAVEIPFTFDRINAQDPGAFVLYDTNDPVVQNLSTQWSSTVIEFAKTGNPNGAGLPEWPHYDTDSRATMVLNATSTVQHDLGAKERELWESHQQKAAGTL